MTAPAPTTPTPARPKLNLNPQARHRNFVAAMWILGVLSLCAAAFILKMPMPWASKVLWWVLLTYVADEAGNWFGYLAIPLGLIPFFLTTPPEQWYMVFPLVAAGLTASLLLKHAGGLLMLPFAAVGFVTPIIAAAKLAPKLDPTISLPANHNFQHQAFTALGIGLAISLVRQLIDLFLRLNARRRNVDGLQLMVDG